MRQNRKDGKRTRELGLNSVFEIKLASFWYDLVLKYTVLSRL